MKLLAEKVKVNVGRGKDEFIEISILINDRGNLVLQNVPSVYYEMLNDELTLTRVEGE
jgi:hypothetical protein